VAGPASAATLAATPGLPRNRDGPLFGEPWQAEAFALAVRLHQGGHYDWTEWVRYLAREIAAGAPATAEDAETAYYLQWLAALEKLVADKGLASAPELAARKAEWRAAHAAAAFGQPVTLGAAGHHDHDGQPEDDDDGR
jgi:nitrile hydratase accessory protein